MKKRPGQPSGEETPEGTHKAKSRKISPAGRRGDEEVSGNLDLNATPLGFDLNAPVAEEDLLQAGSGWLSTQEEIESKPDISEVAGTLSVPVEASSVQHPSPKSEPLEVPESAQGSLVIKGEDVFEPQHSGEGTGIAGLSPKEEEESDEGESLSVKEETEEHEEKPPLTAPAVFSRPFEPLTTSNSEDDLDILRNVWRAWEQEDAEALDMTLADTLEELAKHTLSPNRYLLLSSIYISKRLPEAFMLPRTLKVLLSILESAAAQAVVKRQSMLPVLACKLLFRAFAGEPDWPIEFVQVYLLDSTSSRTWIEHEGCKEFVSNVLTAFPDALLDVHMVSEDTLGAKSADYQGALGELEPSQVVKTEAQGMAAVKSRYSGVDVQQKVRAEFCQSLDKLLGAASSKENPRQLLRLLMQGAGFEEVRVVASSMLEGWLNNPVHLRAAKSLLDRILQHTRGTSENDFNTVANLLALRVSSTQAPGQIKTIHNNIFQEMITHLVRRRPEYATLALKTFVTAELQSKNTHNIKSITSVLKAMPSDETPPEQELALILQELAASEESRSLLRDFVRRMMKQAGGEFDVHALCQGLIQPWQLMAEQDEALKEAWIDQLVDLTSQLLLLAAAPYIEDEDLFSTITSSSHPGNNPGTSIPGGGLERSTSGAPLKDRISNLERFSLETQNFQMVAMAWCTDVVAVYLPNIEGARFRKIVRQLLFLEDFETYYMHVDSSMEAEVKHIQFLGTCTRAPEEIVARLILMGISSFPMTPAESLDIIEVLVCRAAKLEDHLEGSLVASSSQLPAAIFKLASFNLRGVTRQPVPQLVLKDMYWQACLVVLIVAVFNPSTIGRFVWESIPSLRNLMEILITGGRDLLSNSVSEATKVELEKTESEAEQLDVKAEDAVSKFLAEKRTEPGGVEVDDVASLESEWKGKLMLLNQSGPVRRPSQAVYDKLDQFNKTYKLGHLLRKCRCPDYFSEVTALQTLQQAWPWLRNILSSEPEVVTHLPTAWQCELLYMLEGGHPTTRKLSVDVLKLRADLRQVVTTPSKDKEIESIIGFLSHKLVANNCTIRCRARRCLVSLFQISPRHADVQVSLPPTSDLKRTETTPGGTTRWVGSSFDSAGSYQSKKSVIGFGGSSSTHVSPGVSPGLGITALNAEKTKLPIQDSAAEDDTSWLSLLETLPTASKLISAFLPAIRLAMQQETSVSVVVAYLEFLKKHAAPLPSWQSMACSLAVSILQRKLLIASLLSGPPRIHSAFSSESPTLKSHTGTVDLIVESLCEALETGTVSDSNREDSSSSQLPMVTFASPQYLGSEQVVRRVTLHKVVVDASLKVLSLLAFKDGQGYEEKQGFSRLLNILSPDTQFPVAWLEGRNGEKMPLLREDQAVLFARSTVTKLIRAGLAALSLGPKLDLCEKLGLSPVAAITLLQDLDVVSQASLGAELGPRGSSWQRAKKLQNCVHALMQPGNPCGSRFLGILDVYASSSVQGMEQLRTLIPASNEGDGEEVARINATSTETLTGEELAHLLFKWLKSPPLGMLCPGHTQKKDHETKMSTYTRIRQIAQQALLCSNGSHTISIISSSVNTLADIAEREEEGFFRDTQSLSLTLPVLYILKQVNHEKVRQGMSTLLSLVQQGVELSMNGLSQNLESPSIAKHCLLYLRKLKQQIGEPLHDRSTAGNMWDSYRATALMKLAQVPLHRLERLLRLFLHEKLKSLWEYTKVVDKSPLEDIDPKMQKERLILELLDLLETFTQDQGNPKALALEEQIKWTGRSALITEFLIFLDPDFTSTSHFASIFENSRAWKEKLPLSLPAVALNFIIHNSSWNSISRSLRVMLGICLNQNGLNTEGAAYLVKEEVGTGDLGGRRPGRSQILSEAGSVLDFGLLCMRHPRTTLACRLNDDLDPFEHRTEMSLSSFGPSSARAFLFLAVADLMTSGLEISNTYQELEENPHSSNSASRIDITSCPSSVSSCRALKVMSMAACQGSNNLATMVEQLNAFGQGKHADVFSRLDSKLELKENVKKSVAGAACQLLVALYLSFPVSVRIVLHGMSDQKNSALNLSSLEKYTFMQGRTRQTCVLNSVLHRALKSICNGSEKEARAAYSFCHDMARQHPTLVVPHLPTLTVLFKELLPLVKQQDTQVRATVARAYSLGIGLLDALRPHFLSDNENPPTMSSKRASLETILGFYFKFLQCLEVQDRPQFAKVVARLADFLCHCVNAGGYFREYVSSFRIPVLQSTALTFGKIKKLGFLLGMLDKPVERKIENPLLKSQYGAVKGKTLMVGGSVGPPSLPLEDVLKVRSQLLQCIRWQGVGKLKDSRLQLFSRRIKVHSFQYENKGLDVEEVNLVATLSDLERASARMPAILSVLEDSLLELTNVYDGNVRDRAFVLLERLLLHCPSESSAANIVQTLLQQLSSSDTSLAKTAARQASRFFYYCSEFQETMLVEMLQMGRFATDDLLQLLQSLFTVSGVSS